MSEANETAGIACGSSPLLSRFWLAVSRFAYRRIRASVEYEDLPDGVPNVRDVLNPCFVYSPRKREPQDWSDCQGDGHYLCRECALLSREHEAG